MPTSPSVDAPPFEVSTTICGTTRTVTVSGDLDVAVSAQVDAAVDAALAAAPETVVIDLESATFIDSTGIHRLIRAQRHATARGVHLEIIPAPERVHRVFVVSGADALLPFTPPGMGTAL